MKGEIKILAKGGSVTPAALGQTLGMAGLNIGKVVADINATTKSYSGMKIPVTISYDVATKEYQIITRTPSTAQLILKDIGIPKGAGNREAMAGNITLPKLIAIVKKKQEVTGTDLKKSLLQTLGTIYSMGITVDGKNAKEMQKEIKAGKLDSQIK